MNTPARTWLVVLLILGFPFALFFTFLMSDLPHMPVPAPVMPNPNGYTDLVKAGHLTASNSWNFDSTNIEQLHATVAANAEALALARAGLSNECRVPLQFTQSYYSTKHIKDLLAFRQLAYALADEGKLAERENRFGDDAKSYLDLIRVANALAQGGLMMDEMNGIAVESLALDQLRKLPGQLDARTCRETAATLEILDAQRPTWSEVMRQDRAWTRATFGVLRQTYYDTFYYRYGKQIEQRSLDKIRLTEQTQRRSALDLALRAFQLDKGHPPGSAAELVPDYLKIVPQDPFTGTNLVYAP